MELGCKADSVVQLARQMSEFIEGPPLAPATTTAASLDAVADCGTALAEPVLAPEPVAEAAPAVEAVAEEAVVEVVAEAEPVAEAAPAEEASAGQAAPAPTGSASR